MPKLYSTDATTLPEFIQIELHIVRPDFVPLVEICYASAP